MSDSDQYDDACNRNFLIDQLRSEKLVLESKIARYEEALKFYADKDNYIEGKCGMVEYSTDAPVISDNGERAREGRK